MSNNIVHYFIGEEGGWTNSACGKWTMLMNCTTNVLELTCLNCIKDILKANSNGTWPLKPTEVNHLEYFIMQSEWLAETPLAQALENNEVQE